MHNADGRMFNRLFSNKAYLKILSYFSNFLGLQLASAIFGVNTKIMHTGAMSRHSKRMLIPDL